MGHDGSHARTHAHSPSVQGASEGAPVMDGVSEYVSEYTSHVTAVRGHELTCTTTMTTTTMTLASMSYRGRAVSREPGSAPTWVSPSFRPGSAIPVHAAAAVQLDRRQRCNPRL